MSGLTKRLMQSAVRGTSPQRLRTVLQLMQALRRERRAYKVGAWSEWPRRGPGLSLETAEGRVRSFVNAEAQLGRVR